MRLIFSEALNSMTITCHDFSIKMQNKNHFWLFFRRLNFFQFIKLSIKHEKAYFFGFDLDACSGRHKLLSFILEIAWNFEVLFFVAILSPY